MLTLYKTLSPRNKVNKTLQNSTVINGAHIDKVDVLNPTITLSTTTLLDFNYAYIEELNRYYFIERIDHIDANRAELYLSIDVLYTYKDEIESILNKGASTEFLEFANPFTHREYILTTIT